MAYKVRLSEQAFADIDQIVAFIQADSPANARRWQARLMHKIAALDFNPETRWPPKTATPASKSDKSSTDLTAYCLQFEKSNAKYVYSPCVMVQDVSLPARNWMNRSENSSFGNHRT